MKPNSVYSLLAFLALRTTLASGQDDATTICYWSEFRAASIVDALYIDGGTMYKQWPGQPAQLAFGNSTQPLSVLYSLDYSTPFNLKTSNLTTLFRQVIEFSVHQVTPMYSGYMFADANELYTYGGLSSPVVVGNESAKYAFGYQLTEGTPGVVTPELGANPVQLPDGLTRYTTNGAGVNVPSEQLAFYFSGMTLDDHELFDDDAAGNWTAVDQLIEVDMSTFGSPQWSNSTFGNSNIQPRANAELVWVPFGNKGALIAIGGVIYPEELWDDNLSPEEIADSKATSPGFMQNLPVYDIDNKAWYLQEARGPFPDQLTQFCSVVVNDTEKSYDIYIYGGYNGLVGPGVSAVAPNDDVWVLSVPSFTWTKVHSGNSNDGRRGHYCTTPYPEQMFIIGGMGLYGDSTSCLSSIIKIFNLNTLEWQDSYNPSSYSPKGYHRPTIVANTVENSPPISWGEPAIGKLFSAPYNGNPIIQYWPYHNASPSRSTDVGAIAGGTAGGACFFVIIGAFFWYYRKYHKKTPRAGDTEVQAYDEDVDTWRRGVPKTEPSVTTTEIGDAAEINPDTGGYYKPAEIAGDDNFRRHSAASLRPGGFAEAGGGTRRISGVLTMSPRSPRSPRSPNLGTLDAQEVDGEERYEMEDMQGHRGSGDIGARSRFRDHHLYPLSVSDGDGRSQASGPSYSGPSHSHSQASRGDANRGVPSPYLMAHPGGIIIDGDINNNAELPASPVRPNHLQHTRNISSLSSLGNGSGGGHGFPQVSPPLEQQANPMTTPTPPTHTRTTSEDELDALEAFHTGMVPSRPSHKRNASSMSRRLNQLPTPTEELPEAERNRQSTLLAKLPSPTVGSAAASPLFEQERNPLLSAAALAGNGAERDGRPHSPSVPVVGGNGNGNAGRGGVMVGDELYSPSYYSQGSTLVSSARSPISRRPVGQGFEGDVGKGGGKGSF
jgi:hypothetical protein